MGVASAEFAPFVCVHADLDAATEQVIFDRMDEFSVFLATTRMLLGLNLRQIDIVIFLQPYNEVAPLLQGGGRGGRKQLSGLRSSVQVYQLWNGEDLTTRNKLMSAEMRVLCRTGATACTRDILHRRYSISGADLVQIPEAERRDKCCHYHDLMTMMTGVEQ